MLKIYFYPKSNPGLDVSFNPYPLNFEKYLLNKYIVVNRSISKRGVLELFKYLRVTDVFVFNWIENLYSRRHGKLQVIIFSLFILASNIYRKKIVWILHNKNLHDIKNNFWINIMYDLMMINSHLIITHSSEGIEFTKETYPKYLSKVLYLVHPVRHLVNKIAISKKKYDILIWGVILPYKGILPFVKFINNINYSSSYKILIVGKCHDKYYKSELDKYLSDNIIHLDKFFKIEEISEFACQSKCILFTYKSDSVLSSGSLMDSIGMGTHIIAPNFGAFKDLSSYGFIHIYNNYDDLLKILDSKLIHTTPNFSEIQNFCCENSWDTFIERFDSELSRIL